ncbi:MAG TPA: sensor domain-containing protein [Mycobacteriales bacterium]|nr:sensor domain-containing protein [Mycobacteriales bacterium]
MPLGPRRAAAGAAAAVVATAAVALAVVLGRPPLTDVVRTGEVAGVDTAAECRPAARDGEQRVFFGQSSGSELLLCADGATVCLPPRDPQPGDDARHEAGDEPVCDHALPAWDPAAALLPPDDVTAAVGPGWAADGSTPTALALLDPCREGTPPRADDVVTSARQETASSRGAGGGFVQEVLRYASADAAQAAFEEHLDRVARCPGAPGADGSPEQYAVVAEPSVPGARAALVQVQPCDDQGACSGPSRSYRLLVHAADGLTTAAYAAAEDGDPRDAAEALLALLAERLASTA